MALEKTAYDIELRGLSQHSDERKTIPGTLTRAENVEVVKAGALTIRRGFRRIHTERCAGDDAVRTNGEQLFHKVATYVGGVVVLGHTQIFEVVSRLSEIAVFGGTTGIAARGRIGRSGIRGRIVATADRSTGGGGTPFTPA